MLIFCPTCNNRLLVALGTISADNPEGANRLECRTCTFQAPLKDDMPIYERKISSKKKQVDDVIGGAEAWKDVDKTEVQCPQDDCDGAQAFFFQVQTRSADEPMTIFYKCTTCGKDWQEG